MSVRISEVSKDKKFAEIIIDEEVWKVFYKGMYRRYLAEIRQCKSKKELSELFLRIENGVVKGYVYQLLGFKGYMKSEVRAKLEGRKVSSHVIEEIIKECEKQGYLDDRKEAKLYIQAALRKGWGPALVQKKLDSRLKKEFDIKTFINEHVLEEDQRVAIARWIEKKYSKLDRTDLKVKQKIYRFLKGKGFDDSVIYEFLFAP